MKQDFPAHIKVLIDRYIDGSISDEELRQLNSWYDQFDDSGVEVRSEKSGSILKLQLHERIRRTIDHHEQYALGGLGPMSRPGSGRWKWSVAAASLLLFVGIGSWWLADRSGMPASPALSYTLEHLEEMSAPIKNAYLILPDSTTIDFSDQSSRIRAQETIGLVMDGSGAVRFAGNASFPALSSSTAAPALQQLIVPKGNQFEVFLPDGSRVWLNADSKLTFPTFFVGAERHVTLEGEAYFEVRSDVDHPFIVHTNYQELRVTGTKFNVSSYGGDEEDKTALFEGKVQIQHRVTGTTVHLKPGEIGIVNSHHIDVSAYSGSGEAISAWKSNAFVFDNEDISSVMRKLARWYPIDYDLGDLAHRKNRYSGKIRKEADLKEVLTMLGLVADIDFHMDGDRLMAIPKSDR